MVNNVEEGEVVDVFSVGNAEFFEKLEAENAQLRQSSACMSR